jgi:hypothetical protein
LTLGGEASRRYQARPGVLKKGFVVATPIRESISSAAEKIQGIVEAAEEAARAIQAEAEQEADRYREEKRREADALVVDRADRLKELAASLSEHAVRVRSAVLSLSAELNRAADELRGETSPATEASHGVEEGEGEDVPAELHGDRSGWFRRRFDTPRPMAYPGTRDMPAVNNASSRASAEEAPIPDEALLRATQMAVAGRSREEIEEALRRDFGLANPEAVVDDISRPRRGELRR